MFVCSQQYWSRHLITVACNRVCGELQMRLQRICYDGALASINKHEKNSWRPGASFAPASTLNEEQPSRVAWPSAHLQQRLHVYENMCLVCCIRAKQSSSTLNCGGGERFGNLMPGGGAGRYNKSDGVSASCCLMGTEGCLKAGWRKWNWHPAARIWSSCCC